MTIPISPAGFDQGTPGATRGLRHEHDLILAALAVLDRVADRLAADEPADGGPLAWLLEFFGMFVDQCHHGKEEQHLFPALERCGVPREGGPTGVLLAEHHEGRRLLGEMQEGERRARAGAMRRFSSLLQSHIDKENSVLFPLADQVLDDEQQRRLASAFRAVEEHVAGPRAHERLWSELARLEGGGGGVVDVRAVPARHRHPMIFDAFDRLSPGETFVLVNDHDPKPLYYQFAAEHQGGFTWQYLERGPEVWRVEIGRTGGSGDRALTL
jgi:hemerythrin-like domain-containing protein